MELPKRDWRLVSDDLLRTKIYIHSGLKCRSMVQNLQGSLLKIFNTYMDRGLFWVSDTILKWLYMVLCVCNSYTFQNICKTSLQATAGLVLERTVQCLQTVRFFGMFGRFDVRSCLFEVRSQNPRVMFEMFEVQYVNVRIVQYYSVFWSSFHDNAGLNLS